MRYKQGGEFVTRDYYLETLIDNEDNNESEKEYKQWCSEQIAMGMTQDELPDYDKWLDEKCEGMLQAEERDAISIVGW